MATERSDAAKRSRVEFVATVCTGMILHFKKISVADLKYSSTPGMEPNLASSLFCLSILCMIASYRTIWSKPLARFPRPILFLFSLTIALFVTDFVLRNVWIPTVKNLFWSCQFLGNSIGNISTGVWVKRMQNTSFYIKRDAIYVLRFVLAVWSFCAMLYVTGFMAYVRNLWKPKIKSTANKSIPVQKSISSASVATTRTTNVKSNNILPDPHQYFPPKNRYHRSHSPNTKRKSRSPH